MLAFVETDRAIELPGVPSPVEAVAMARLVRQRCRVAETQTLDIDAIAAVHRARITERKLDGGEGGREALLIPLPDDRFGIAVDPTPPAGWGELGTRRRSDLRRHRLRFRVGHELGHTFFYSRNENTTPRRRVPDSARQEHFCDLFSRNLLVPHAVAAMASPDVQGLIDLHETFDVSLQVAARAMAAAHRDVGVALWCRSPAAGWSVQWATPDLFPEKEAHCEIEVSLLDERGQLVVLYRSLG
jgi:hypothetical protein